MKARIGLIVAGVAIVMILVSGLLSIYDPGHRVDAQGIGTLQYFPVIYVAPRTPVPFADLNVLNLSADPDNQQKGQSIHFKVRIKDQGAVSARDFKVVWWPKGSDHSGRATLNNEMTLGPGESEWIEWDYTYTDSGDYQAEVRADYEEVVNDEDRSNNSATISIEIHS